MTPRCRCPAPLAVVAFVLVVAPLFPQALRANPEPGYSLDLHSYSGSPLLLELTLDDPEGRFDRVDVVGGGADLSYRLPMPEARDPQGEGSDAEGGAVTIPLSPFLVPGVYDLAVRLFGPDEESGPEPTVEVLYRVGFVDYVWGRDNFRFGNNGNFETLEGDYSLALFAWLEERFGEVSESDKVLLVHYMYGLFGNNPGRCYAFSGTQYRYITSPERLPRFNDTVYDVRGGVERVRREMHFLQMDIVFDRFVAGGMLRYGGQGTDSARSETEEILRRIENGRPVVAGFIGPGLHHSMLVYGFIDRLDVESIDLLVANNWKEGQDSNRHNKNAEYVRVNLGESGNGPLLDWQGQDGPRPRQPDRFFVVEVKEQYEHDRVLLDAHLTGVRRLMRQEGVALLVLENAASAWLTDPQGNASGYRKWRRVDEIEGVTFQRRKRAYSFEIATDAELLLHVEDDAGARIYYLDCTIPEGEEDSWILETEAPEEKTERLFPLSAGP